MIPYFRVVQQYELLGVLWLGRFSGLRKPGLRLLFWPFHKTTRLDLREEVIDIPKQTNITRDNAPIRIDFLIYMRVIESMAQRAMLDVMNYHAAVIGVATTTLRAVIGDLSLDEVLSKRERINEILRSKLDEITERWGIKVTQVEIREIEPPPDVQEAMNKQMSAERLRRAAVTEAEGTRQAAIKVAEGDKQASILKAEGHLRAQILAGDGDRQATILRAAGFSKALDTICEVARTIDANTLSLQYFETLKKLGNSVSTKFVLPMEFTSLLNPFLSAAAGKCDREKRPE